MKMKVIRLDQIEPYQFNPRINIDAVPKVMESIRQVGYNTPIVVDEDNIILAGHTRYAALLNLGYTEAECVVVTGLTDEQKRKFRILDNKTGEIAEWDEELLSGELEGLELGDIDWFDDLINKDVSALNEERELERQCRCPRCGAIAEPLEVE